MGLVLSGRSFQRAYVFSPRQITVPFTDSHSARLVLIPIISCSTFLLVIYSTQILNDLSVFTPGYLQKLLINPGDVSPPKDIITLGDYHIFILIYIPCIIIFLFFVGSPMAAMLRFHSKGPSGSAIQNHIRRFIKDIERRA